MYGKGKKLSKLKTRKQFEEIKINSNRNPFELKKKKKKETKDRITRDIRTLFEEEGSYKSKRVINFWNNNYNEYESNGDGNKNLSLEEYLNKIKPYLRDIIIDLQESDTRKIQLAVEINFISSKDVEKECEMDSKSDNIKFTSYNDANEVVDVLCKSLRSRYLGNLKASMEESEFIFHSFN